jgi:hypothetical protein
VNAGVGLAERVGLGLTLHSGESQSLPIPWAVFPATASHRTDTQQQAQRGTTTTTCLVYGVLILRQGRFGSVRSVAFKLGTWKFD